MRKNNAQIVNTQKATIIRAQRRDLLSEVKASELVTGTAVLVLKVPYALPEGMTGLGEEGMASFLALGVFAGDEDISSGNSRG